MQALRLRLQLPGQPNGARYRGLPYEFLRAQAYATTGELVEVERPTQVAASAGGSGECDMLLTNNRLVDCKAWSPQMWRDASEEKRVGMIAQLTLEIQKYLGDPTGYTLRLEFQYAIPARSSSRPHRISPSVPRPPDVGAERKLKERKHAKANSSNHSVATLPFFLPGHSVLTGGSASGGHPPDPGGIILPNQVPRTGDGTSVYFTRRTDSLLLSCSIFTTDCLRLIHQPLA